MKQWAVSKDGFQSHGKDNRNHVTTLISLIYEDPRVSNMTIDEIFVKKINVYYN